MLSHPDFLSIARSQLYVASTPKNILPTSLDLTREDPGWIAPAYATFGDIPITGEMLQASLLVCSKQLNKKVSLPPNLKELSKAVNLSDHEELYIAQYKTAAATIEYLKYVKHPDDETVAKAIRNWSTTCDNLIKNPHFGAGWKLPFQFTPRIVMLLEKNSSISKRNLIRTEPPFMTSNLFIRIHCTTLGGKCLFM